MLIFGIFEQSIELEQALAELESNSIRSEHILVVFMESNKKNPRYNPNGPHAFEIGIASGTGGSVIGASIGFAMTLGPIIWGLIGAATGFGIGLIANFLFKKLKNYTSQKEHTHEVTVVIQCQDSQTQLVSNVLWEYQALSVGFSDQQS